MAEAKPVSYEPPTMAARQEVYKRQRLKNRDMRVMKALEQNPELLRVIGDSPSKGKSTTGSKGKS